MTFDFYQGFAAGVVVGLLFVLLATWMQRSLFAIATAVVIAAVVYKHPPITESQIHMGIGSVVGYALTGFTYWLGYFRTKGDNS